MFQKLIFEVVLSFVIRQIAKYGDSVEWDLVREDIREYVRKIIPGDAFDETCVSLVDHILDGVEYLIENIEFSGVLEAIKSKDLKLAIQILRDLIKRYLGLV